MANEPGRSTYTSLWPLILAVIVIAGLSIFSLWKWVESRADEGAIPREMTFQMTYEVIQSYPHDPAAFTQGLIYEDGVFYESTGLYGESSLRKVDVATGEVLMQEDLPGQYFAEGLTNWENSLVQLTWQEHQGFVYDKDEFTPTGTFDYLTEGWGLTQDDERLIMSDGTSTLSFLDPDTFEVIGTVTVTDKGQELVNINELEYIRSEVFANIWLTDDIIRIDPDTGEVLGWIDMSGLLPEEERTPETNVLNGIAFDSQTNRLFVTGKFWPKVYEIRLVSVEGE
ncbi:glutaminyl-peptide cyclotransferase [Chloroflexota bacterium]|nr:glutaminyl-peptide cyclotransferase [Chloroflexota bacterium]